MKKKLIAIVASLAMVATMVPATAFAAVPTTGGDDAIGAGAVLQLNTTATGTDNRMKLTTGMRNVDGTFSNGTMKLNGYLRYVELGSGLFNTQNLSNGHFLMADVSINGVAGASKYAMLESNLEQDYTGDWTKVAGNPYRINKLTVIDSAATMPRQVYRVDEEMPRLSVMICYLNSDADTYLTSLTEFANHAGVEAAGDNAAVPANKEYRFADATDLTTANSDTQAKYNNIAKINGLLNGTVEGGVTKEYLVGKKTLTFDLSSVTLLSKNDTEAIDDFATEVDAIDGDNTNGINVSGADEVDAKYIRLTERARYAYEALTSDQKGAIAYAVANKKDIPEAEAYNGLLDAEKNIEAYKTLSEVAELIKAVPDAKTLDLTKAEDIAKVTAAERAYAKLPAGAKKTLRNTAEGYLTKAQIDNFDSACDKVSKADVTAIEEEIAALKDLPTTFTDQETVAAYAAPWRKAQDDFDALTEGQQNSVSNKAKLTKYRTDYITRIKAYVNPIWEELADIDVKAGLKPEERAKVAELKSYIDNEYVETAWIDDPTFVKKTYDALVEALNGANENVYSLEKATVEAIAEQTYTGKAIKPAIAIKDGEGNEIAAENYYVSYDNNLEVGEATVTIVAKATSDYYGEATATFTIKPAALTADMVKVANATYTGKALKPAVSVASGVDYTVAYKNNTAVGKASAVVTGTG
ncbi:MAG: hypothetical protein HFE76_16680, partial [Firmicutes bacterium]|nr:hypothetical protein [Bacillota bacterium]